MKIKIGSGLLLLNLFVVLLTVAVIFSLSDALRIIVGLPFVLFFPGYVLVLALFPSRVRLGSIERVALGFGLSIIVVPLIGFILNYTPWGLGVASVLGSVAAFIVITSVIAWIRVRKLPEGERFDIEFQLGRLGLSGSTYNKVLSLLLAIIILTAIGTFVYVIVKPEGEERFTEFYMLGPVGKVSDYPSGLEVGEEGKVILGIINHEGETVNYNVEVAIDGVKLGKEEMVILGHEEKWEGEVTFTLGVAGDNQKVEFRLRKNGDAEPSLEPLHLWIDVSEAHD